MIVYLLSLTFLTFLRLKRYFHLAPHALLNSISCTALYMRWRLARKNETKKWKFKSYEKQSVKMPKGQINV